MRKAMSNETKRDVFDDALRALEEFGEQGSSWEMAYDDLSARYTAAIQYDLPVIPDYVARYINHRKSSRCNILDVMNDYFREDRIDKYIENNSDTFARAWLDGYQVEEEK